jgi:hypothetical protein
MIPEADAFMNIAAGRLLSDIAPNMAPGYSQGSASTLAMVMILAAQEYGRAAETRAWENAQMRALLARGGVSLPAPAESLSVAALNAENAALSRALIALHAAAEEGTAPDSKALEQAILAFLKDSAQRRRLYLPVM